jgi:hypothetical protein
MIGFEEVKVGDLIKCTYGCSKWFSGKVIEKGINEIVLLCSDKTKFFLRKHHITGMELL